MAKLYKVRKKCMICGNIFYPKYAGSLYCEDCKNKKKVVPKKEVKKKVVAVKKIVRHIVKAKLPRKSIKKQVTIIKKKTAKKASKRR
jgi:uncharacterized Zn finger protein (UPF0148 family)